MKKSFRILALGLAILPSLLFIASCDKKEKDRSLLNISGNYEVVENSRIGEVDEFLGDKLYKNISGIQSRAVIKMSSGDESMTSEVIATYKNLDKIGTNDFQMSYVTYQNNKKLGTIYVLNNTLYSSLNKTYRDFDLQLDSESVISPTEIDLTNIILNNAELKVYVKDDIYKINYKRNNSLDDVLQNILSTMDASNIVTSSTNTYLVFKNDNFIGMSSKVSLTCTIERFNYNIKTITETVLYDEEIDFPEFDKYTPVSI